MLPKSLLITGACALGVACSTGAGDEAPTAAHAASGTVDNTITSGAITTGGNATMSSSSGSGGVSPIGEASSSGNGSGGDAGANTAGIGTSSGGNGSGDNRLFVPDNLSITKLAGDAEPLTVFAATLLQAPTGPEFYATLRNEGDGTACDAAITFEFFDQNDQSMAAWVGGLYSAELYRPSDGSGTILACLSPGGIAMAGAASLPPSIVVDELGYIVYRLTYFGRDVLPFEITPVDAISVSQLETVSRVSGSAFRGMLENGLDVAVENPTVSIFPVNAVGRPLGLAVASELVALPPGESWTFETSLVNQPGTDQAIYPGASLPSDSSGD